MSRAALLGWLVSLGLAVPALADTADLEADLVAILDESAIRGAAIRVVGAQPLALDWGVADAESRISVDAETRFCAGSLSKLVTSLLALRAAQAGVLSLDDPVARWLPDVLDHPHAGTARLVHLLEHTAGLAGSSYREYGEQIPGALPGDYVSRNQPFRLRWSPGTHFSYANGGHTIAAHVLERAWDADFDTLVEREVLRPIGLEGADFQRENAPRLSQSFAADGSPAPPWHMTVRPSGALIATADELMRLLEMLLARGRLPDATRFLPAAAIERMERGETSLAGRAGARAGSYGLGNFSFVAGGGQFRGHWGRTEGFQTNFGYRPEDGSGFVLLVNTADRRGMGRLRDRLGRALAGSAPESRPPADAAGESLPGVFVNHGHDMPLRAWLFALFEAKRLSRTADGDVLTAPPWPLPGSDRRFVAVASNLYRAEDLVLPTATLATVGEETFWVDGDSFRQVSLARFYVKWAVIVAGLLACIASLVALAWGLVRRRRYPASPWLALAGASYLALLLLFIRVGLLSGVSGAAHLGSPSAASLGLTALSVLGPAASAWGLAVAVRTPGSWAWAWGLGLPLLALGGCFAAHGWVPLRTWLG